MNRWIILALAAILPGPSTAAVADGLYGYTIQPNYQQQEITAGGPFAQQTGKIIDNKTGDYTTYTIKPNGAGGFTYQDDNSQTGYPLGPTTPVIPLP